MKKTYTKPQIVDYGSIAEMTAGQSPQTVVGGLHSGPCFPIGAPGCK